MSRDEGLVLVLGIEEYVSIGARVVYYRCQILDELE